MSQKNINLDLENKKDSNNKPKLPWLALILSLLFPGLGQFYNNTKIEKILGYLYLGSMLLTILIYSFFFDPAKNNGFYDILFQSLSFALTFASSLDCYQTAKEINQTSETVSK